MAAKKVTKMKARKTTARAKATKKATPRGIRSATRAVGFGTERPVGTLRVPSDNQPIGTI
jgi:hypothetical protein